MKTLHDAQSQFCILHAALSWEADHGFITDKGRENLAVLISPSWTFQNTPSPAPVSNLDLAEAREYRRDLETRLEGHHSLGVSVAALTERIRGTLARFELLGFWDYYAGQEGTMRVRLFAMAGVTDSSELNQSALSDAHVRLFAAYYMAYTDYVSE